MVDIAEELGFPTLAADLTGVFKETILTEIPLELRSKREGMFFIVPQSYRRRLSITVYQGFVYGIQFFKRVVRYGKRRVLEMVV